METGVVNLVISAFRISGFPLSAPKPLPSSSRLPRHAHAINHSAIRNRCSSSGQSHQFRPPIILFAIHFVAVVFAMIDWGKVCSKAYSKSLPDMLATNYTFSAMTVRCIAALLALHASAFNYSIFGQIFAFALCAAVSAIMHLRWRRINEDGKRHLWRLYGWFTGLVCFGCCTGALAWIFNMQRGTFLFSYFKSSNVSTSSDVYDAQISNYLGLAYRYRAGYLVSYSLEFLCLSVAKLMVLDRMMDFAAGGQPRRWVKAGRYLLGVVVFGNVVGVIGNIVAAVLQLAPANQAFDAADAFANNDASSAQISLTLSLKGGRTANNAESVQQLAEIIVLLLLIIAFCAVGWLCARRINSALNVVTSSHAQQPDRAGALSAASRRLRNQIVGTVLVVFVTFLPRIMYCIIFAVANAGQDIGQVGCDILPFNPCDSCFNTYTHVQFWIDLTPEFQLSVILISSPLALLVALWGMTSERALQLMQQSSQTNQQGAAAMGAMIPR